jgi:endoglucanase
MWVRSVLAASFLISTATIVTPTLASSSTNSLPVGRCVNMGNHLEPPSEGEWGGKKIETADLKRIADAGFNTIRLPVRWSTNASSTAPYQIDPAFMRRVKGIVADARGAGLNVILDSHHFEEIHKDPSPENIARLAGLWKQIAKEFASESEAHLWFEIENEPHDKFNDSNLLDVLKPALAEIRKTNPTRPVIIGGEFWSGINSLATLKLPDDPHIVPTFHYYDPFDFTHQGATWVDNPPPMGRVYGTEKDRKDLTADVQKIRDYIKRTGKTPFMGEFGANGPIPHHDRVKYQKEVRVAFDAVGIGMCAWGYTNTFPLWDQKSGKWLPGMLGAMGLVEQEPLAPASGNPAAVTSGIQLHPKLVGKGEVITDYSHQNWPLHGAGEIRKPVPAKEVPGRQAFQFEIAAAGANHHDIGLTIPVNQKIEEGDILILAVLARSVSAATPDGNGRIGIRIQKNAAPYPGFADNVLKIGPKWVMYELRTKARMTLEAGQAAVGIHLAGAKQVIEIGQIYLIKEPKAAEPKPGG